MVTIFDSSFFTHFSFSYLGVIGKSFLGDSAIDDVRFTRGCVNSLALIWPRVDPCGYMEFACTTDGACRDNSVKYDFTNYYHHF